MVPASREEYKMQLVHGLVRTSSLTEKNSVMRIPLAFAQVDTHKQQADGCEYTVKAHIQLPCGQHLWWYPGSCEDYSCSLLCVRCTQ